MAVQSGQILEVVRPGQASPRHRSGAVWHEPGPLTEEAREAVIVAWVEFAERFRSAASAAGTGDEHWGEQRTVSRKTSATPSPRRSRPTGR